jgi:cytosine/adenosine deaminase-related metal-dependent hydrolase
MYPARSLLDAGGEIAGASDWCVSSPNPFLAIGVAETRSAGQGGVLDATQRVPREAMLYAYTRNAAHALNQLDEIGSLAPGKRADMILIDRDVLTVPVAELNGAKVDDVRGQNCLRTSAVSMAATPLISMSPFGRYCCEGHKLQDVRSKHETDSRCRFI